MNRTCGLAIVAVGLGVSVLSTSIAKGADPLMIAKQLADTKYKDWTYGDNPANQQINCVQFVLAVVEESLQMTLGDAARKQVLISNLTPAEMAMLGDLITSDSPKIKGVQQALVDMNRGVAVPPEQTQPGDLIQYWMKKNDGTWAGHTAVIETVECIDGVTQSLIFGASESQNKIATSNFKLKLINDPGNRRLYVVRIQ